MIPSIVFHATDLHNIIPRSALKAKVTVSRNRDVVIKNENLDEGLYLFRYDASQDHFYGVKTFTAPLALVKIKAISNNGVVRTSPLPKILKASSSNIQHIPDNFTEMMKTLLGDEFNTNDYTFEIKATQKVETKVTRMPVTSETIENQFRSGRVTDAEGKLIQSNDDNTAELFVAFVFYQDEDGKSGNSILIDIGELWDQNSINMEDLEDIFLDRQAKPVDAVQWAKSTSELSPQKRQDIADKQTIASRTQAFDEIMRDNNSNFDSNMSVER